MRPEQRISVPAFWFTALAAALVALSCMTAIPAHAALQLLGFNPANGANLAGNSVTVTFNTNCSPSGGDDADCKWSLTASDPTMMENNCGITGGASHSCDVTGMQSGVEVVYFGCFTIMGQCASFAGQTSRTFNVPGTNPPVQSGWNPANGANITTANPVVTLATNVNAVCKWSLMDQAYADMAGDCTGDGGMAHACAATGLSEGANTVSIACRGEDLVEDDAASNDDLLFTVDTSSPDMIPPVQSGWNPGAGSTITSTTPSITFTTNENADCKWSLSDQAYAAMAGDCTGDGGAAHTCAATGLPQGAVTVSLACRDVNNNQDTAGSNTDLALTVDSIQPVPGSWNPAGGSTLTTSSPTVTFTTNENADCKWSLSDQAYAAMAGDCAGDGGTAISCDVSGLSEGANTVSIACQDTLGNQDTAVTNDDLSYTLDTTSPVPASFNPPSGGGALASFNLTFSTNENADCRWSLTDQAYADMAGDCTGDGGTSHTCAVSGFVEGLNTMSVSCRDTVGNEDTAGTNDDIAYTVVFDSTPPVKSGFSPASGSYLTTGAVIALTTDEAAYCRWATADAAYADMAGDCDGDGGAAHSCALSGLANGAAAIYIGCADIAGNQDTADSNQQLNYTVDTTPPSAPSAAKDGSPTGNGTSDPDTDALLAGPHTSLYANWQHAADAESGIAKYYCAYGTTADASDVSSWTLINGTSNVCSFTGLALVSGTMYYISVKAENAVGLQSAVATTDGALYAHTDLCGDVNKDGRLRSSDLALLDRHVAGTLSPALTAEQQYIADIADAGAAINTPDGTLNATDIQLLADAIIGKKSPGQLICPAKP